MRNDQVAAQREERMSGAPAFGVRSQSALYWGVTWGVGVGIIEYLTVAPIDDWGSLRQLFFWLVYWMMPYWCAVGCLFVRLADRHEHIAHRGRFMASFISLCVITAVLQPLLSIGLARLTTHAFPGLERYAGDATLAQWSSWNTLSVYQLWETSFYGGLLVAARIFTVRVERARHLLHESAMARGRTEGLLDAARLQALQSQIDPNLLLDSMQELEQRYRASPERAERLLEALVEFLRYAMHGLRVPVSTLHAELQLARAFSQLQHERGVKSAWRIVEEPTPSATPFKFPSLLILPLMALGGDGGRPMLRVRAESDQVVLTLHGLSRSLSAELSQQVQGRLYALYGKRFKFEPHLSNPKQLRITLQTTPTPLLIGEAHA
jgi:signal transduction histidine kinase